MEGKAGADDAGAGGGGADDAGAAPLPVRCNASERAHAGQLALLPVFSAAHLLGSFSDLRRVGQRRNRRGWYGCNSAVYECSVVVGDGAEGKADAAGAAGGLWRAGGSRTEDGWAAWGFGGGALRGCGQHGWTAVVRGVLRWGCHRGDGSLALLLSSCRCTHAH